MTAFGERIAEGFRNSFEGERLYSGRSSFQKIEVWDHAYFGRTLVLDDLVQTTEYDEYCYHEMLVHPVLSSFEAIESVLVIGGGDGGTLRHALQHSPKRAVMCEIDGEVVRVSRELLPSLSDGAFEDPRTELVIDDGAVYVERHPEAFDAIIVDSTDPFGAAEVLVSPGFYASCRRALRPGGVLVAQTGSPFHQADDLRGALTNMRSAFSTAEIYLGFVPSYPGVLWSFCAGTEGPPLSKRSMHDRSLGSRFFNPEVGKAAFSLPAFVKDIDASAKPASVSGG
jgi:spermidine synthase